VGLAAPYACRPIVHIHKTIGKIVEKFPVLIVYKLERYHPVAIRNSLSYRQAWWRHAREAL
jgi:hypothetical protein